MNSIAQASFAFVSPEQAALAKVLVDKLGAVKAKVATLTEQEKELRDQLAAIGDGAYEGTKYRATVTTTDRTSPDEELKAIDKAAVEAARAKLSHQYLTAHTEHTPTTTVRVVARVRK